MWLRVIVTVIALTGCRSLLGIEEPATCTTIVPPISADSQIVQPLPTGNFGANEIMRIRSATSVLLEFDTTMIDVTDPMLSDPNHTTLILTLPPVVAGADCAPPNPCGLCSVYETAGQFDVAFVRTDWAQSTVTWNEVGPGVPWGVPGAMGTQDRSAPIGSVSFAGGTLTVEGSPADLRGWADSSRVDLIVSAIADASHIFRATEYAEICKPTPVAPTLEIRTCL